MSGIQFDYYYGAESEQFSFVRVPRVLFTDKEHFGNLSNEAKLLYGFLLERMNLSRKNNWIDEQNRVYIVFPIDEIEELLGVGHDKANNILKELDDDNGIGLVRKKRRGLGLPSILYVKNFIINDAEHSISTDDESDPQEKNTEISRSTESGIQEVGKTDFKKSENPISAIPKNRLQEVGKTESNYKDISYKEMSYIENQSVNQSAALQNFSPGAVETVRLIDRIDRAATEKSVKEQIDYDCLVSHPDESVVKMVDEVKDLMVDVLCGERSVVIGGKRVSEETAKSAYRKITAEHVQYVLQSIVSYPDKISRIDRFLTASLFNSVYTLTNATFAGFEYDMGIKMV